MTSDAAWVRKLAEWQGGVNATIKSLAKNQDEIEARLRAIGESHTSCREQVLTAIATLEANAKNEGKKEGRIWGLIAGLSISIVTTVINIILNIFI